MVVHVLVIGILLYVGNRIGYLFLAENTGNLSFADNLLTAFNRTFEELSKFSPQFSYEMRSLGIGAVAAISYILFVLYKTFDEKNTRPNEEYGSARWGKYSDIRAFLDKKKDFNILLTKSESLSLSGRMKITRNDNFNRNKNVVVVGGAGSGKTRFYVKPNLMQMHSSYVVSDSKGLLLAETGKMFEEAGYQIKIFDLINRRDTHQYNPFQYIQTEDDILKIVNNLIKNTTNPDKKGGDDFWEKAETALLMAIFSYLIQEVTAEDRTLGNVIELVRLADIEEDVPGYVSPLDILFNELEQKDPTNFAVSQYKIFKLSGDKTTKSILVSLGVRLSPFDIPSIKELVSQDTLELDTVGDVKTILYILLPDTDTSFNFLASMMYQQLFDMLVYKADNVYKGRLPCHVRCILDEFANIGQIPDFEKVISVIRSREISTNVILQNISQLKTLYKDTWETIIGTSDVFLYLGGMEQSTHEYISKLLGKQTIEQRNTSVTKGNNGSFSENFQKLGRNLMDPDEVASLKGQECILKIRGVHPFLSKKYDIVKHKNYKKLGDVTDSYMYERNLSA
ncbi:VirD4-like conjugal transfer protein, CD1115 family [Enterococcus mundtii]|uniref:Type IV secretory system conjugative DNA transfer family protein n=1 Tax=Enterococcus mundtii TaxID=53346 RepID=A0A2T5DCM9_ENTMU|nr:type IV secretory system conjugative DNA transfer family protein [Enterococcus mundtii]MBE6171458.1 type IV secretory system conjugative DNA transfer family protein [Enterococcus faecium]MBO1086151.1 type IV secretory system conjugative DNA transfer family protein [Enterococcus mundtii]MDV7744425.1 type IV secretory system conjugative DNA transfer family protein [Enterococcus mundtii]OBS61712.1 conjugal transfer protein TraG [Enterococcus mundtii]PQC31509.1 type IV secretory system conjugat